MYKHVTLSEATKANDWKCTGGINAGQDSYRIYQSESVREQVLVDGKDKGLVLRKLRGVEPK